MNFPRIALLSVCVTAALAPLPVPAQATPADRNDAALAYAQCVRDNGYAEFPDPKPDGFQFLIAPQDVARFKKAAAACESLAPAGMRGDGVTPEQIEALLKLAQCIRDNGVSEFPDPTPDGRFDLTGTGIGPGDTRVDAAMAVCRDAAGPNIQLTIGG